MKAAIFDMDGLMYDTEKVLAIAWYQVSKEFNLNLTDEIISSFRGSNKEYKRSIFKQMYGQDFDYESMYNRRQEIYEQYFLTHPVPIKKGLMELLAALKNKGYKIAIATATSRRNAEKFWKSTNVIPFIDATICGDEVINCKPNPEIFLKAAEKLNVDIHNCYVLEDSPNGLKAGRLSGAKTIMIPDLTMPTEEIEKDCDYIFESLFDVIPLL